MKKQNFRFMVIFAAVFLIYGCSIHPQPVTNPNSGPYTEPIHFPIIWGDNELFDEKMPRWRSGSFPALPHRIAVSAN